MAYVPGYRADVFISYAHFDDKDGWVTQLKSKLAGRLMYDLAGEAEVWFDADRVRTGDRVKQEIRDKLSDTLLLLAVVSPSYLKSQFCREEELDWFLDNQGREVIQVLKIPLERDTDLPLPDVRYEYLYEEATGTAYSGDQLDLKLKKLIFDLRNKLEDAKQGCRKIYLAHPRNERLRAKCQSLKRELHRNRYAVLPSELVTLRTLESKILKWIEDAEISIHLRTDPPDPLSDLQLRISEQAGRPRIIVDGPLWEQDFPDILAQVSEKLSNADKRGELYFVYDYHSDEDQAAIVYSQIEGRTGRKVVLPQAGETYHKAKLQKSDGVVLFRSGAPEQWFRAQRLALEQAVALRRDRSMPTASYRVSSGSPERVIQDQAAPLFWKVEKTGMPDVNDLQPFLEALP